MAEAIIYKNWMPGAIKEYKVMLQQRIGTLYLDEYISWLEEEMNL